MGEIQASRPPAGPEAAPTDAAGELPNAGPPGSGLAAGGRLQLDENVRDLVLCHAHYFARDFLPALRLARSVKNRASAPDILRVEAVRMEAEVFLLQRGPGPACFFFEEAARIGEDEFVTDRISQVCSAPSR